MEQAIVPPGATEAIKADQGTVAWAAEHADAAGKGPGFRCGRESKEIIETEGYLGLGLEVDEACIAENF